jgi:hypothetical protein
LIRGWEPVRRRKCDQRTNLVLRHRGFDRLAWGDPRPGAERKLNGKEEALLVATACSNPPAGRARWTLDLLAGEMVKLTSHEGLSRETVRRRLAENDLKPWRRKMWCIPRVDAEYVARMEPVQSPRQRQAKGEKSKPL